MNVPDRFLLAKPPPNAHVDIDGIAYDPAICIRWNGRVVQCRDLGVVPKSRYLLSLSEALTPGFLEKLDRHLAALQSPTESALEVAVKNVWDAVRTSHSASGSGGLRAEESSRILKLATKLAKLVLKHKEQHLAKIKFGACGLETADTSATLWPHIVARTDEIYMAAERAQPAYDELMAHLVRSAELPASALLIGALKDPIRVHEKAIDDYAERFPPSQLAEACMPDVLRARAICSDSRSMAALLRLLLAGVESADGARLSVLRVKNKIGNLDPTHFRYLIVNCELATANGDAAVVVELQVHHQEILKFNDVSHAHDHYDYFRAKLAAQYNRVLDEMLERTILFLTEVRGIPVLLSMVVLIFASFGDDAAFKLPSNREDLYAQAMDCALRRRLAGRDDAEMGATMIRAVAAANQEAWRVGTGRRRVFTAADVKASVLTEAQWALWRSLCDSGGVPLVKVIAEGNEDCQGAEYQFRHLSFQARENAAVELGKIIRARA